MKQGYSGSTVRRSGDLVVKISSDQGFVQSRARKRDLIALSRQLDVLPRIARIDGATIVMEYVEGQEGLTGRNAGRAGQALRLLHECRAYPHPCYTGLTWLIQGANDSLARMGHAQRVAADIAAEYPNDALIHSEPTQFIEREDGAIVFIDFEGIGMGSRYHDLGFIYYSAGMAERPELFAAFLEGYESKPGEVALTRVKTLAAIVSLAYAQFADAELRIQWGLRLLAQVAATG